jgi:L-ascorbate metabolism protein UlaG (beta-lactamase superfamily)
MGGNKITWLGHSTFLVTTQAGKTALIDPWLAGNPSCPPGFRKLPRVDVIAVTHGHSDHIGSLLDVAREHKSKVVATYEICLWLGSKGIENLHPMNKGGTQKIEDMEFSFVDAHHSNSIEEEGKYIYGGEPGGYIIRTGGFCLYHAGDTDVFGDMKMIADLHAPELACLPIGDLFTMGPRQAALAIRLLGVKNVIPMHWGTFPALTGTPEKLRDLTKDIPGLEVHAMKPGQTLE